MTESWVKGIALILFGMLLVFCQPVLSEVLYNIGELVSALLGSGGLACGIFGLTYVFTKGRPSN